MHIDTWYDLAVRELSELTDRAKEIIVEAEKAGMAIQGPVPKEPKAEVEPPAQAA
jgi:hypothetical protein